LIRVLKAAVPVVACLAMVIPLPTAVAPLLTPCIGVCRLDVRGFCVGCQRTGAEIAGWRTLPDSERRRYMEEILPARELP
jgi:predicted Fe-S protein YdhL (DUF1289 family)